MTMGSRTIVRFIPSLAGLIVLALFVGLWLCGARSTYVQLLTLWGVVPFQHPFLDLEGSLSAWECTRQGIDVIVADPCDFLLRGYNYSPFWLSLDWIPLDSQDRVWTGFVLDLTFLLSLSALPSSTSRGEVLLRIAATVSTMVAFAVERANPDILIFMMVVLMLVLLRRSPIGWRLGYCIAFLAGAIKYYPFVLFGLVAKERLRIFVPTVVAMSIALAVFYCIYSAQILEGLPRIASGTAFTDMLGITNFPIGAAAIAFLYSGSPANAIKVSLAVTFLFLTAILWAIGRLCRESDIRAALGRLDEPRRLALLTGALLLCGCFFAGQSIGYRGIFLLLTLPGLSALGRDAAAGATASAARLAAISIPFLMWAEAMRVWAHLVATGHYPPPAFSAVEILNIPLDILAWGAREVTWWLLIAFLVTLLLGFFLDAALSRFRELRPPFRSAYR